MSDRKNTLRLEELIVWLLLCLVSPTAHAATVAERLVSVARPCSANETWTWSRPPPEPVRFLFLPPKEAPSPGDGLVAAFRALERARAPSDQRLLRLGIAHVLFQWRAVHPARDAFVALLREAPPTEVARDVAAECLLRLHEENPFLEFDIDEGALVTAPATGNPRARSAIAELGVHYWIKRITRASSAEIEAIRRSLPAVHGSRGALLRALLAARLGDSADAQTQFRALLELGVPAQFRRVEPFAHLALARYAAKDGRALDALVEYAKVPKSSEWFPQAVLESAWLYLEQGENGKALGVAYNLRLGGRAAPYGPDGLVVASLAHVESCHFPAARRGIGMFRRETREPFQWLRARASAGDSPEALYRLAVAYARDPKSLPRLVGAHWLRAPRFLAAHSELNLVLDEHERIAPLVREARRGGDTPHGRRYQEWIETARRELREREAALVTGIGRMLSDESSRMLRRLELLVESARQVEIEALAGAGDEAGGDGRDRPRKREGRVLASAGASSWKWGRRLAIAGDDEEVWRDEVGDFQADLENRCGQ